MTRLSGYINEYVPTTSAIGWRLRIGAFNLAGGGSPTPTPTASPSSTPTPTPTATPAGCQYTFATGSDPIVPGTTDTGNHTDDGDTFVALPFSFQLYDQTYNGVNVNSNGRLDFVCINEPMRLPVSLSARSGQSMPVCLYDFWSLERLSHRRSGGGLFKLRQRLRYLYLRVGHRTESHLQH